MVTRHVWLILLVPVLCGSPLHAAKHAVSGYVVSSRTGETIIGVNVTVRGTEKGSATDGNGYFVIPGLETGTHTLDLSHVAFERKSMQVRVTGKSLILPEIALIPKVIEMQGVSIVTEKAELADLEIETGHRAVTPEAIRRIPTARSDVFRAVKYLPGVQAIDPVSPLYSVRGSETGENLILLDGVPVYNPYHFVSASGLFNIYAVKNVELMVGGFGAEYGGRNSSVLYITTREGNNERLHGEISPSTTSTNAVIDFPACKNVTVMLSGRWYYDIFTRFLLDAPSYFYDTNLSLTWKMNARNRLTLRWFYSRDHVDFKSETYFNYLAATFDTDLLDDYDFNYITKWRNQAVSLMMKTILNPRVYWETRLSSSVFTAGNLSLIDYQYTTDEGRDIKLYMETDIRGRIRDLGLKSKLDINISGWNELKFGVEWNRYHFENDVLLNGYSEGKILQTPDLLAGFIEDKISIGGVSLRPGLRMSRFGAQKDWNGEIRINAACHLGDRVRLKAAHGVYLQHIVSINTQEYELSQFLDTCYPLEMSPPSQSRQSIAGIEADITRDIRLSVDLYYKDIVRTYAYDYNAGTMEAGSFMKKLRAGQGESYGLELLVRGRLGKLSGWISYSWSRSKRRFPHIMDGQSRLFDYDCPQTLNAVLNHQVNASLEFSGTLQIMSGIPKTLETGYAAYYYYDPVSNQTGQWPHVVTPVKNNIRLPYVLRLDLGMKKRLRRGFGADLARYIGADSAFLNVSLSNVLFAVQRNVWFYIRNEDALYGLGSNYFPVLTMGYSIRF